jgi:hypothetical protein
LVDCIVFFKPTDNYSPLISLVSGLAYITLVLNPFLVFLAFAHVKFWLALHEWSKWPRWTSYAIFCLLYLVVNAVLCLNVLIFQNVANLIFDMIVGVQNQYRIWYQPLAGVTVAFLLKN